MPVNRYCYVLVTGFQAMVVIVDRQSLSCRIHIETLASK